MRRISEMAGTRFDGVANPYVPPPALAISDRLALHRDQETDLDPKPQPTEPLVFPPGSHRAPAIRPKAGPKSSRPATA